MVGPQRKIIHVDMDCFYAACEVKHRPDLRGKAIGIGGPPNSRSVLCTASYEARRFGVRAAMPSSQAVRLCPQLILIRPNFDLYKRESRAVKDIFAEYTPLIEPLSLDEAYLDVTGSDRFGGSATLIAQDIRRRIKKELNLTASAGVAPNKFLAKVASDWNKPDGLFVVRPEDVDSFVKVLPVEKIFGVGKVTSKVMHEKGLKVCGDIQNQSVEQLTKWFGSRGESLYRLSRGIDNRGVATHWERKSLTVEETFHKDIKTIEECLMVLPELYNDWNWRMKKANLLNRIKGYVVKVKFFDFTKTTHEVTSKNIPSLNDFEKLFIEAWNRKSAAVRLIGLGTRIASPEREPEIPYQLKLAI